MYEDQVKGRTEELKGRAQEAAGNFTEDQDLRDEGKARRAAGKVQANYGEKIDCMREATVKNPISALAIAGGVGVFVGILLGRR
ncbi:CsbD family protein [Salinicola avicenniae]|uniref:CsbD family protein n=1 Tax=Salinicola avicenniae TaxID=2916836 RepID=UPI002073F545|nr:MULTISPECIES: CsbD family protein [unclassified Salinicola]